MSSPGRKSKWHLFSSKDKDTRTTNPEPAETTQNHVPNPRDSAYASSGSDLRTGGPSATSSTQPSFNGSDNIGAAGIHKTVNEERHNHDSDDEETITTTTTTTTVTTTRVGKGGKTYTQTTPQTAAGNEEQRLNPDRVEHVETNIAPGNHHQQPPQPGYPNPIQTGYQGNHGHQDYQQQHQQQPQNDRYDAPNHSAPRRSYEASVPSNGPNGPNGHNRPNVPLKSAMRSPSPNPPFQSDSYGSNSSPTTGRSNNPNFSRPYGSREPYQSNTGAPLTQEHGNPSTLGNLKAAAAGIHGVGETLRGTFNQAVDKRAPGTTPETLAANERVLQAGRSEMDSGRFDHSARDSTATAAEVRERERIQRKQAPGEKGGLMNKLRVVNH